MNYLLIFIFLFVISGCSSVEVKHYSNENPRLKLEEYLNGTLDAYGIFQDRSGTIIKRFHCVLNATWKDRVGTFDERFEYSDGTKSTRVWTLTRVNESEYTGTAGDVIGEAHGEVSGNAFHWRYILDVESKGTHYHVNLDDWMYLMDSRVMLNRSRMSKFGFDLGQVTLAFVKR
jgi:hypothetical protein